MEILFRCFVIVIGFLLSGCVSMPVVPKNAMPKIPEPDIYGSVSQLKPWLDCLSGQLSQEKNDTIKITVAALPNTMGTQTPGINLPSTLQPYIKNSLHHIKHVFKIYNSSNLTGIKNLAARLPSASAVAEPIARDLMIGPIINVDVVLTGSIYMVQETKAASLNSEIYGLGLTGEVKCYDIAAELTANHADSGLELQRHALSIRLYKAEQGLTFFKITGGELAKADSAFVQSPSVNGSLQFLSDFLTAAVIRDLAEGAFKKSYGSCDQYIIGLDNSRIPTQASLETTTHPVTLALKNREGQQCLVSNQALNKRVNPSETLQVVFRQYSSPDLLSAPIEPAQRGNASVNDFLRGEVCLPKERLYKNAKSIEVLIFDHQQNVIGTAVGSL